MSCSNLKLHQTLEVKNTFRQEKIMLQLTLNPGLTSTGFRTTRPRVLSRIYLLGEKSRVAEPPKGGPEAYIFCNDNNIHFFLEGVRVREAGHFGGQLLPLKYPR